MTMNIKNIMIAKNIKSIKSITKIVNVLIQAKNKNILNLHSV